MLLITSADDAQIAQEVVVATLRALLRRRGSEKEVASKAGVSPVYLSYILHDKRMPRMRTARRLATYLPFSEADRHSWLEQIEHYWVARRRLSNDLTRVTCEDSNAALWQIRQAHVQMLYTADPALAEWSCQRNLMVAQELLQVFTPVHNSVGYLDLCGILHEAYSLLDRQVDALAISKHAQAVANLIRPPSTTDELERFDIQRMNSVRLEVVSLNHFGLAKLAYERSLAVEMDVGFWRCRSHLGPVLYWDRMNAMARLPRSSIREAKQIARTGWLICDQNGNEWSALSHLLVSRSLAEVCITHENFGEAELVLKRELANWNEIPHLGPLHKVMFLRTYARLIWNKPKRDVEQWREHLENVIRLATQANLYHQLREIRDDYGEEVLRRENLPLDP